MLIVGFLWAAGSDLQSLARVATTSDYYIYSSNGLAWLFFVLAGLVFLLDTASVWYLYRPAPVAPNVLLVALIAGAATTALTLALALGDIDGVRNAYEIGREARGLAVRPEALAMIFSPRGMLVSGGLSLLIYLVLAALVSRNKRYFDPLPAGTVTL